jgi:hypothetical protein
MARPSHAIVAAILLLVLADSSKWCALGLVTSFKRRARSVSLMSTDYFKDMQYKEDEGSFKLADKHELERDGLIRDFQAVLLDSTRKVTTPEKGEPTHAFQVAVGGWWRAKASQVAVGGLGWWAGRLHLWGRLVLVVVRWSATSKCVCLCD